LIYCGPDTGSNPLQAGSKIILNEPPTDINVPSIGLANGFQKKNTRRQIHIYYTETFKGSTFDPDKEFKYLTELWTNPHTQQYYLGFTNHSGIWNEDIACNKYYQIDI
jgi:hypothetical protein